ncbi:lysozyme inhibitor LprI family protein [Ruegeria arenilitoris]|uniref:lysozyme inhibitor LprI family protein n=1 Tax=Ruegeria arenilitoris TaxID=1173585 RepID=UPI0014817D6C|nr:lysozyme inhibitor LprI family protein [Ruegeria arenilitoris]
MIRSAIILSLLPTVVSAQQAFVDKGYVQQCSSQELVGNSLPECVGQAANLCQTVPGQSTTLGITECIQEETLIWDAFLNEQYQLRRAELAQESAELANELREAQRAWISFRDAECGLQYSLWSGGTIRSIVYAGCVLNETAERALELRDLGKMQ